MGEECPLSREREEKVTSANPLSTIFKHLEKKVTVYLKGGEKYAGILAKVDNYMNLVLEETMEERS
ncbi:MAG: LSM domain-containing protein, partial [Candidatus Geothermarchaeales archaeon]